MGLTYNDSKGLFKLDISDNDLTEEKILNAGLNIVDKCDGHYLVEYKSQIYDINTESNTIVHHRSLDGHCGTLYYGYGYLYEMKKLLQ